MVENVVIGGHVSLSYVISGDCTLSNVIDGQAGTFMPIIPDAYTGELTVIPKAYESQTLECALKTMPGNVTVTEVPYYETHNQSGMTAYIASEV